jgi:hypothetical protein
MRRDLEDCAALLLPGRATTTVLCAVLGAPICIERWRVSVQNEDPTSEDSNAL